MYQRLLLSLILCLGVATQSYATEEEPDFGKAMWKVVRGPGQIIGGVGLAVFGVFNSSLVASGVSYLGCSNEPGDAIFPQTFADDTLSIRRLECNRVAAYRGDVQEEIADLSPIQYGFIHESLSLSCFGVGGLLIYQGTKNTLVGGKELFQCTQYVGSTLWTWFVNQGDVNKKQKKAE